MQLDRLIERTAAIGYESQVEESFVIDYGLEKMNALDLDAFKQNQEDYTIVDVRNSPEVKENKIFDDSIHIPLAELRSRTNEIPTNKPIVVHCAGGYRSAAASSLIQSKLDGQTKVFDLGEDIKSF